MDSTQRLLLKLLRTKKRARVKTASENSEPELPSIGQRWQNERAQVEEKCQRQQRDRHTIVTLKELKQGCALRILPGDESAHRD